MQKHNFKTYEDFLLWLADYEKQGGKTTDFVTITLEQTIYQTPLDILHAYNEG